jgi:hypothetical protein
MPMTGLAERFRAAADRSPLCALAAAAEQELATLLERTQGFEDLPGKWQAALLQAEAGDDEQPAGGHGSCCGGH